MRRGLHPEVAKARTVAFAGGVFGFSLTVFAVLLPKLTPALIAAVVSTAIVVAVTRRMAAGRGVWETQPSAWALAPALVGGLAFFSYGLAIAVVHIHFYGKHVAAYDRSVAAYVRPLEARSRRDGEREEAALVREKARAKLIAALVATNRALAEGESRSHTLNLAARQGRARQESVLLNEQLAETEASNSITANDIPLFRELRLASEKPGPPKSELPLWFGRLGGFFTVATQILAALVLALAFSAFRKSVSSKMLQAAMPLAIVGVLAGIVGNLPSLGSPVQTILLGPVSAGLMGGLAALTVIALGLEEDRVGKA
jgi:hypothetical protein